MSDITWPSTHGETVHSVIFTLADGRQVLVDYTTDPPTTRYIGGWQVHITPEGGALEVTT